ncbi:CHAD domain-containing protein [uncultured Gimesia sp.]|uniref:CHAD domain-containing protein n=1 Tax=uncultured Gimesia sp. TaxID=1678688 RepID=UPI0030DCD091|tara:strand:+ start:70146 stop:71087 length:942 start_codon:yes stop_codon:yes gene_type:complete
MSYQFKQQESLESGVRRIAAEQLSQAIRELKNAEQNPHQTIHEVRKHFKKLRGMIRLVCSGLGDDYARLNVWYRDAGRRLSRVRDAESMLESLQKLKERFSDPKYEYTELFSELENRFLARKQQLVEEWIDLDLELQSLSQQLEAALEAVEGWKIKGKAAKIIRDGLQQTYQRGADALAILHQRPDDDLFHESRKRSKYHLYHMRLISAVWQPMLTARIAELDLLNDYLGDDHDLTVMTQLITSETESFGSAANVEQLLSLIREQRQSLQTAAFQMADRIFAEKPKAFARRMQAYWTLWRDERGGSSGTIDGE